MADPPPPYGPPNLLSMPGIPTFQLQPQPPTQTQHQLPFHLLQQLPGFPQLNNNNQPNQEEEDASEIVCVVCGGACKRFTSSDIADGESSWLQPVLIRGKPRFEEWQKQTREWEKERDSTCEPRLSHLARRLLPRKPRDEELIKIIEPTEFLGGSRMRQGSSVLDMNSRDSLMRLPIHKACYDICQRFCKITALYKPDRRDPSGGPPKSVAHLYEIWCKRAIATCPEGPLVKAILEPYMYMATPPSLLTQSVVRRSNEALPRTPSGSDMYPLSVPNLTTIIVQNLQTMDGKEQRPRGELAKNYASYCKLPTELRDLITDALDPFEQGGGPPLTPTRFLDPVSWKKYLFSGKLIPWLWDLDEKELEHYRLTTFYEPSETCDPCENKASKSYIFDENMWDWELLCRQLAQPNVMRAGGLLGDQSPELSNRYRIWKVLDRARLGHVRFS